MTTKDIQPTDRIPSSTASKCAQFGVEFAFDEHAPPTAGEIALLAGILPDILAEMARAAENTKED